MAVAVPTNLLWARMLHELREHHIDYPSWGGHWVALMRFRRLVRQGTGDLEQQRLLRWIYLAMGLAIIAFLGFATSGVAAFSERVSAP